MTREALPVLAELDERMARDLAEALAGQSIVAAYSSRGMRLRLDRSRSSFLASGEGRSNPIAFLPIDPDPTVAIWPLVALAMLASGEVLASRIDCPVRMRARAIARRVIEIRGALPAFDGEAEQATWDAAIVNEEKEP